MSKAKITKAKLNFTKASIEALPLPEKGWTYYYDFKVQGLGIGAAPGRNPLSCIAR